MLKKTDQGNQLSSCLQKNIFKLQNKKAFKNKNTKGKLRLNAYQTELMCWLLYQYLNKHADADGCNKNITNKLKYIMHSLISLMFLIGEVTMPIEEIIMKTEVFVDRFFCSLYDLFPQYKQSFKFHCLLHLPDQLKKLCVLTTTGVQILPKDIITAMYESKNHESKMMLSTSRSHRNKSMTMLKRIARKEEIEKHVPFEKKIFNKVTKIKQNWDYNLKMDLDLSKMFEVVSDDGVFGKIKELENEIIGASFFDDKIED
uniref:Uncharacterized protein n=1 Tax=Strongyloides stercoralis TaxID=6248 RepID=A0AAF5CV59_STRER